MRWNEILTEGVNKYKPMFTTIYGNNIPKGVLADIASMERQFRREDRIIWALRWYRHELLINYDTADETEKNKIAEMIRRSLRDMSPPEHSLSASDAEYEMRIFQKFESVGFDHYLSLPIQKIKNYVFKRELPSQIEEIFSDYEEEWQETLKRTVEKGHDDEILIDFGNGWAWFNLNKSWCSKEGAAMGHCGNEPSARTGDRVLSLRQHIHDDIWSPHLTFILDKNGFLGEMKGRNNEKPVEKYHPMIIALLKNPIVFGIKGGGYEPENNFSLDDLNTEEYKEMIELKPGFNSINSLLIKGDIGNATKLVEAYLSAYNFSYEKILPENKKIIILSFSSPEQFCGDYGSEIIELYGNIRHEMMRIEYGETAYENFYHDTFITMVKDVVVPLIEFKAELEVEYIKNRFCLTISYYAFDTVIESKIDEDHGYYGDIDDLTDTIDSADYSWVRERINDLDLTPLEVEVADMLIDYTKNPKASKSVQHIVDMIMVDYSGMGSYTTNDPRQLRFDLGDEDDRN